MRVYAYIRVDPNASEESKRFVELLNKCGYQIPHNRILFEEIAVDTSILYRDKIVNLINYGLEKDDLLILKGIDCLGGSFEEMLNLFNKIDSKNIKLISLDYMGKEIKGDLKVLFKHFLRMCIDYEAKFKKNRKSNTSFVKRVGRPEILNAKQKEEVLIKFKKGASVYSLAKEYSVTRTVIQRILNKAVALADKKL